MTETTAQPDVAAALEVALQYGSIDGAHHKQWVIDQMVRCLTGCRTLTLVNPSAVGGPLEYQGLGESAEYDAWVARQGGDWDAGIAP